MRVTLRPAVAADLAFVGAPLPLRIRAITATIPGDPSSSAVRDGPPNDRVIGIGGIGYGPDGTVIAFAHLSTEARNYPAAIHRAGLRVMDMIRRSKINRVVADADLSASPAAERWLERLGFRAVTLCGRKLFVWQRN
jgi:hypothetical protein